MTTSFVGIYAGRLEHPHYGGEVPFVFYANRIAEMFKDVQMQQATDSNAPIASDTQVPHNSG